MQAVAIAATIAGKLSVYREEEPGGDEARVAQAKLDALRNSAARKREEKLTTEERARIETQERIVASGQSATSSLGVVSGFMPAVVAMSALFGVLCVAIGFINQALGVRRSRAVDMSLFGFVLLTFALVGLVLIFYARASIRKGVARELAWARSLPFTLTGQFNLIGAGGGSVAIAFEAALPEQSDWINLLAGVNATPLSLAHLDFRASDNAYLVSVVTSGAASGRDALIGWRRVVTDLLVPTHARYAIKSVVCN